MLRNLPFHGVILYILTQFLELCGRKTLEDVIKRWRGRWRGRGGRGFAWRKYPMLAQCLIAGEIGRSYIIRYI
jgi:hypothetical protein